MIPAAESSVMTSVLGGGFLAAFLHAALPTHWLPFTLVGRAQGWAPLRVLAAVAAAGLAHIATTAALGTVIVVAGLALNHWVEGVLPHLAAALLFAFGVFYLARSVLRRPVGPNLASPAPAVSNRTAFVGLVTMMAVSPGEVLLPLYLSSAGQGVGALALLTLMFALGTVAGMAVFTTLASAGASILKLERWARHEGAVLGVALIALGLLVMTQEH